MVDGGLTQHLERPEDRKVAAGEKGALKEADEPEERRYYLVADDRFEVRHDYSLPWWVTLTTSNEVSSLS